MAIAQAVLAALVHKGRTGEGQVIEVPMLETMVAFNLLEHQRGNAYEPPIGHFGYDRLLNPYRRPYRTADGWAAILPYNDGQWLAFFRIAGRAGPGRRRALRRPQRPHRPHRATCTGSSTRSPRPARPASGCSGAPRPGSRPARCSTSRTPRTIPTSPPSGCSRWSSIRPRGRTVTSATAPVSTRTPTGLHRYAPRLGEHTGEVLAEAGLSADEIQRLLDCGAAVQHVDPDGHQAASST